MISDCGMDVLYWSRTDDHVIHSVLSASAESWASPLAWTLRRRVGNSIEHERIAVGRCLQCSNILSQLT